VQCPGCGVDVMDEATFCHRCGESLVAEGQTAPVAPFGAVESSPAERFAPRGDEDDTEITLWEGSYSPKAMIGTWIMAAFGSIVLLIIGNWLRTPDSWLMLRLALWAILITWCCLGLLVIYRRMNVRYQLSNQRFVHEQGILKRVTDRIEVIDMDDVTFERGIIERMVGTGTIKITSSDRTHPEILLKGIDDVAEVAEMLDGARRKERLRRGLHIEAI